MKKCVRVATEMKLEIGLGNRSVGDQKDKKNLDVLAAWHARDMNTDLIRNW